jgi:hypothetical protein
MPVRGLVHGRHFRSVHAGPENTMAISEQGRGERKNTAAHETLF